MERRKAKKQQQSKEIKVGWGTEEAKEGKHKPGSTQLCLIL